MLPGNGQQAVFPVHADQDPVDIAREAMTLAQNRGHDIVLIDTAGRLHIDDELMLELIDALEDSDDVQNVFTNFDAPDEVMAQLEDED